MSSSSSSASDTEDRVCTVQYEPIHKLAMIRLNPPRNPARPFTSFSIRDILGKHNHKSSLKSSLFSHYPVSLFNSVCNRLPSQTHSRTPRVYNGHRFYRHHRTSNNRNSNLRNGPEENRPSSPEMLSKIVRPWDISSRAERINSSSSEGDEDEDEITVDDDSPSSLDKSVSPLDALMEMASKTFDGLHGSDSSDEKKTDGSSVFGKNQSPKKRRKSRTAFTNQQIYELEKRFLYQKYLTPADRDEIAINLGLTNAQVITWFQNRRAKLKRDLEEMKNDVDAARRLNLQLGDKCSEEHARDLREAEAMLASKYNIKDSCRSSIEPFTRAIQNDPENYKLQKHSTKGNERNN